MYVYCRTGFLKVEIRGGEAGGGQSRYVWILKCDKAVNFTICGRSWVREMSSVMCIGGLVNMMI